MWDKSPLSTQNNDFVESAKLILRFQASEGSCTTLIRIFGQNIIVLGGKGVEKTFFFLALIIYSTK